MIDPMPRSAPFWLVGVPLLLGGCLGTDPHRPEEGRTRPPREPEPAPRAAARAEDDPWSIEGLLPRSGDPARPNVKVEVGTVEIATRGGLSVRAAARGSLVRGVLNLQAAVSASGGQARARTRTSTFVVVQAGHAGSIALTQESRALCGPWQGLWVEVLAASPEATTLAIQAIAPGAAGDRVGAATEVTVRPGEAVVLGGYEESREAEARGFGRHDEAASSRQLLVLLTVDVLG